MARRSGGGQRVAGESAEVEQHTGLVALCPAVMAPEVCERRLTCCGGSGSTAPAATARWWRRFADWARAGPVQAHERAKTPRANHRHLAGHQYDTDAKNAPRGSEYRPIVIRFIT